MEFPRRSSATCFKAVYREVLAGSFALSLLPRITRIYSLERRPIFDINMIHDFLLLGILETIDISREPRVHYISFWKRAESLKYPRWSQTLEGEVRAPRQITFQSSPGKRSSIFQVCSDPWDHPARLKWNPDVKDSLSQRGIRIG